MQGKAPGNVPCGLSGLDLGHTILKSIAIGWSDSSVSVSGCQTCAAILIQGVLELGYKLCHS